MLSDILNAVLKESWEKMQSMLGSHVSGGYWLQAPAPMNRYMPKVKTEFPLEYEGTTWDVVWLPRKSGAGLSGGWRTFAIDVVRDV